MQFGTLGLVDCRERKSLRRKRLFLPASCREICKKWRAKNCARIIPRAKNGHDFSEDSDDFRNGLLSQQRQRRSIFFIIFLMTFLFCVVWVCFVEVETPRDQS